EKRKLSPSASSMRLLVNLAMRILGPCRSPSKATKRPWRAAISRTSCARARCSSGAPWEKFRRATSSPARIIFSSTSGELLAGPSVATIFVRREVMQCSFFRLPGRLLRRWAVVIVTDSLLFPPWDDRLKLLAWRSISRDRRNYHAHTFHTIGGGRQRRLQQPLGARSSSRRGLSELSGRRLRAGDARAVTGRASQPPA